MEEQTELLRKILEVLTLIAEPHLEQRDQRLRAALYEVVGKSKPKFKAVSLMDGTRTQSIISKEAGIDAGALSRLLRALREKALVLTDDRPPKLAIPLPPNFLAELEGRNG